MIKNKKIDPEKLKEELDKLEHITFEEFRKILENKENNNEELSNEELNDLLNKMSGKDQSKALVEITIMWALSPFFFVIAIINDLKNK